MQLRSLALVLVLVLCTAGGARAQQSAFSVDGNVALSSLISLGDGHLQTVADTLETLAATAEARSGEWGQIEAPLARAGQTNADAVLFFARANGTYWTVQGGRQQATLSDRPYFARVLSGNAVIGDLVTSRSTGKPVAIVAVPIRASGGNVIGLLGASVLLDRLSSRLANEMGVSPNMIFWAVDPRGVIAIHSDTGAIFLEPGTMSPQLSRVMAAMLAHDAGTQTYEFRGNVRTVIYRKSALTGWRYGFGILR